MISHAAGYLIRDGKVLLVHHKKFNKWTPPEGGIEGSETPDQALIREWQEELSLNIEIIPAHENAFAGDSNSTPIPMPFHIDLEREGFKTPHLGYFFYVKVENRNWNPKLLESELYDMGWFGKEELLKLNTFDQVKALAHYAIDHYPA